MKAIVATDQAAGTAGVRLVERPEPQAAINDVVVQIYASGFTGDELTWPSTWTGAFIDPRGLPVTDLYVAPGGRAYTRPTDGELWLSGVDLNPEQHTVRINCYFIGAPTNYAWQLSDPNHLGLTSLPPDPP